ncbi:HAD family hydrolase [Haloechinothrix sp. LS1_15]|uniref:HAD family hydrolase n=1 Tax=Haloechinothrix sp. LS1_15 TaxID=2652248 RepID=UPI0029479D84|nr:HAD family hydrolase [Haloechinothrix sp. LS1_15]MDV6012372.1 HAD family phosphatase [Haloechinothrix sp. LS1_15]
MHRPHLIASDVDGTLVTPLERFTDRTRAVLRQVHQDDVPFVLVSGRPPRWIPPIANPAGITGYAVCANGAVIYDIAADRVISTRHLPPVTLRDAAEAIVGVLPRARFGAERVGTSATDSSVARIVTESAFHNPWGDDTECDTGSRADVLGTAAIKLLVSDERMASEEMAAAATSVLDGSVAVTYSSNGGLIEISAVSVTKATGLAEIVDWFDVDPGNVIAFGDMPNDVAMLGWAGHGVAVANAHPAVLEVADEITGPNTEDGVAQVLERWF